MFQSSLLNGDTIFEKLLHIWILSNTRFYFRRDNYGAGKAIKQQGASVTEVVPLSLSASSTCKPDHSTEDPTASLTRPNSSQWHWHTPVTRPSNKTFQATLFCFFQSHIASNRLLLRYCWAELPKMKNWVMSPVRQDLESSSPKILHIHFQCETNQCCLHWSSGQRRNTGSDDKPSSFC